MRYAFRKNRNSAVRIASRCLSKDIFTINSQIQSPKKVITPNRIMYDRFYVKHFISTRKNIIKEKSSMELLLSSIKKYFENITVNYSIKTSDFVDPEYPEWQEKRITIKVNTTLNQLYENIKPNLLQHLQEKLEGKHFENIIIKFEILE